MYGVLPLACSNNVFPLTSVKLIPIPPEFFDILALSLITLKIDSIESSTPNKKPIKIQMNISDYKKRKLNNDYDSLYNYNNNTGYKYDTSPYGTSNKFDTATNTKTQTG